MLPSIHPIRFLLSIGEVSMELLAMEAATCLVSIQIKLCDGLLIRQILDVKVGHCFDTVHDTEVAHCCDTLLGGDNEA